MGEIKTELRGNVLCYGRVSTKSDEQAESLENQRALFDSFLKSHQNLICVGTYLDQESGKSTERKQFLRMIDRVAEGDIRYILAKDSSRLSRSAEVSGSLNRICERYNCKILFVGKNEVYDPADRTDRLINNVYSAIAEDFVYRQSELGKLSHIMKVKERRLNANNEVFGYRFNRVTKQMEINEDEAAVVRLIFELYVYKNMGVRDISRELAKLGLVGTRSGKPLTARTITQRLTCTAYIGKMAFNKVSSVLVTGVGAKSRREAVPKEEWVYASCPRIISDELFELAQIIREERTRIFANPAEKVHPDQSRFRGTHLFSTKVFCGACGYSFHHAYADRAKQIGCYVDSFGKKRLSGEEKCSNLYNKVFEEQLIDISLAAINTFIENQETVFEKAYQMIKKMLEEGVSDGTQDLYQKRLETATKDKMQWLEAYKDAVGRGDDLMKEECLKAYHDASKLASELEMELDKTKHHRDAGQALEFRLQLIKKKIKELRKLDTLTRMDIDCLIKRIEIYPDGMVHVILSSADTYQYQIESYEEYKKVLKNKGPSSFYVVMVESPAIVFQGWEEMLLTEKIRCVTTNGIPLFLLDLTWDNARKENRSKSRFFASGKVTVKIVVILQF